MNVFEWLRNARPTIADPNAVNPPRLIGNWQITGTPLPQVVPATSRLWTQSAQSFPSRILVQQPPRITVVA